MKKVFEYIKPYTWMLVITTILLGIEVYTALIIPGFMADIVNYGVLNGHIPTIWRNGAWMLGITLASMALAISSGFFTARITAGVTNSMREGVFTKVLSFSSAEVNKFSTSSLMTRTTNDIMQVQNALAMAIRLFIYAPMLGIGGIIRAVERNVSLTWVVAVATMIMVIILFCIFIVALPKYAIWQDLVDRLNLISRENLTGMLISRAFSTQKFEKKRFEEANQTLVKTGIFVDQSFAFLMPSIMLVLNLTTALIVWIGAREASAFRIDIGDIFAFLQYGMMIIFAFLMVAIMFIMLPRAIISARRIQEVLDTEGSIHFKENPTPLPSDFKGELAFRNVNFRYPDASDTDENVLVNVSFTAKPGTTTAIIGATGAGKSSLFKLILRFFDVTGGGVYLDGIDIRDLHKEVLHTQIGYVPQKALLFKGTIESNLMYADSNATTERIEAAVKISQAAGFIAGKPEGYAANVAQGGTNFSGGQRQRLSIARALVKKAQIYLFDDSFSALDMKTDAQLRAALKENMGDKTIIVIAQRVSSIMDADQIVVLDHGTVVGAGKHGELLKNCAVYKEIAVSQLSEEEVNAGV
ncbi:MAG: ABC transporter ATP-binding protein/permease [Defluviitaleaceae bacterium]|nr:ABC transporter ATP-binding protein/permease [Defluviitaleaceae bacterium]